MFKGIETRLNTELRALTPDSFNVNIIAPEDRQNLGWFGGSMLGSMDSFINDWMISKDEYDEQGPNIVHRKCF